MKPIDTAPDHTNKEFTVLMALLMSVVAISIDALLPALGYISEDLQLAERNHAQYLIVFIFVGMAFGQLVCGPLSDALGRKKILYGGLALYLVGSVVCYISTTLEWMLFGRMVQGLGVSGPYVSAISIVRDKFSGRHMARIMSIVMMIFIMVPAIAPSLGQGILLVTSWRAIFILYIVYAILVGIWLFFRLEETLEKDKRIPFTLQNYLHGLKEVVGNRMTLMYLICMGICFGSFIGYLNSSQQIFQEQFGVGKMFTVYFGLLALVFGVASLVNAKFVEKIGMHTICMRAMGLIIVASLVFLGMHMVTDVTLVMFLGYAAFVFFAFGLIFGNINALAMEPMGHIAGMASAIIGSGSSVISMLIGAAIGQMYNGTLVPILIGFTVLSGLSMALTHYAHSLRPKKALSSD